MSRVRVRPTFEVPLRVEPPAFFAALERTLSESDGRCRGLLFDDGALLRIRDDERRFWSPALHLHVDGGILRGKFSPSSPVWTAFIGIYIALICIATAAACYGWAQMGLEETPWAFVGVPVAVVLAGLTYGAAFIGQGLGAEDMYELRSFVEKVAESAPHDAGGVVRARPARVERRAQ